MHIWQAIKMASKSLWTNKLRSFLTMLGIIIGVMTVALLTSVASGVQTAVVSQIRTQSTLSVIMATSNKTVYSDVESSLIRNQPEKEAEDYFDYTLVKTATTVVANDVILDTYSNSDIKALLQQEKLYTDEDLKKFEGTALEPYIALFKFKNAAPINTTINLVDENYLKVFDLKFEGKFPQNNNEIMVDEDFVKTNFGKDVELESVIGKSVTVGVKAYQTVTVKFNNAVSNEIKDLACEKITPTDSTVSNVLGVKIIPNEDGTRYIDGENNTILVNVEFYKRLTVEELAGAIYANLMQDAQVLPNLETVLPVTVEEVYDDTNAQEYKITAAISADEASVFGANTMGGDDNKKTETPTMSLAGTTTKGNIYMKFEKENFGCIGLDEFASYKDVPISMGYLRYKTEDVMSSSTSGIMVDLQLNEGINFGVDFMMISMSSVASIVDNVMDTLTIMLTVISVVSLIIGGIGIMNIMLVAVTERTREIGIRKAIGAKKSAILVQFLVEALMLSLIGGAIGLGISAIGCAIIGHFMGVAITMPLWVIGMSLGFCTAIGLIFGMFPAIKASNMQPIDALRRE